MGYYHNSLLLSAYDKAPSEFFNMDIEEKIVLLGEAYEDLYNVAPEEFDVDGWTVIIENIIDLMDTYVSELYLATTPPMQEPSYISYVQELFPGNDSEWAVFGLYFEGHIKTIIDGRDTGTYYQAFRNVVLHSAVGDDSKEFIMSLTSVAAASSELWEISE